MKLLIIRFDGGVMRHRVDWLVGCVPVMQD